MSLAVTPLVRQLTWCRVSIVETHCDSWVGKTRVPAICPVQDDRGSWHRDATFEAAAMACMAATW